MRARRPPACACVRAPVYANGVGGAGAAAAAASAVARARRAVDGYCVPPRRERVTRRTGYRGGGPALPAIGRAGGGAGGESGG